MVISLANLDPSNPSNYSNYSNPGFPCNETCFKEDIAERIDPLLNLADVWEYFLNLKISLQN